MINDRMRKNREMASFVTRDWRFVTSRGYADPLSRSGPPAQSAGCRTKPNPEVRLVVEYSSSGRKIPGLPNNRTNEMIGGCEIRSLSGRPPTRPLHDDSVERRLVVHRF
jgi:hypothetical protein